MEAIILNYSDCGLTLFTLSLVKASIFLWEHTEIQTEIQRYFSNNDKDAWKPETFHKITGKVLDVADVSVKIAPVLLPELKDAILNTGVKIYNWIVYVCSELGLNASYAKNIYWTALGFVDHNKIFELVWAKDVSLFEGSPYKRIFRVACLLTQVDFVEKHESDMIKELKELLLTKNLKHVDFEVENYSGKTYGIISSYLCYYLYQSSQIDKKNRRMPRGWPSYDYEYPKFVLEHHFGDVVNFEYNICYYINRTIHDGEILRPEVMAKLCAFLGSVNGLKFYYGDVKSSEKRYINDLVVSCCVLYLEGVESNYLAMKYREILTFIYNSDPDGSGKSYWENKNVQLNILFRFCPLESVVMKRFIKRLNEIECNRNTLNELLRFVIENVKSEYSLRLPLKRSLYQKLLKEIWWKVKKSKIKGWKTITAKCLIDLFVKTNDFTNLKTFFNSCEWDLQYYLSYTFRKFDEFWYITDSPSFDGAVKFFNEMFESSEERDHFYNKKFYESVLLLWGDFEKWENLYTALNFSNGSFRDEIDPVKCLSSLTFDSNHLGFQSCDEFIAWWANSQEERRRKWLIFRKSGKEKKRRIVIDKFKKSSHAFKFLYCFWLDDYTFSYDGSLRTSIFLEWLFGSDDKAVQKFKKNVSIMELFDVSFENPNRLSENVFYSVLEEFINCFEISAENLNIAKKEISRKIKSVVLNNAKIKNISTLDFLMKWVSTSEENRKEIFQKLIDSGKMLSLCEEAVCAPYDFPGILVFYNKWLKRFGYVSKAKNHIISIYKGEADDDFMSKLSLMFEKLENGEDLSSNDIIVDA